MSADELQRWASILRWVGLSVTTIGILITFGSHYVADKLLVVQRADKVKAQERQRLSDEQLVEAKAQAEAANKLASELKLRQQPRVLPEDFIEALTAELTKEPKKDIVEITCVIDDPEAWSLAEQIRTAFTKAGFTFERIIPTMTSPPIIGMAVCSRELSKGPIYSATAALLTRFNLPLQARPCPEHMKGTWIIQVGKKP